MFIKNNSKAPGDINLNKVHDDEHATAPEQTRFEPESQIDNSTLSTMTSRSSTIYSKSSGTVTHHGRI